MTAAGRMRELLRGGDVVVAPGAYDALSARIIERIGFPAVYLTGAGITGAFLGMTDLGLITMTEIVQVARNVALAVGVPVICDADTGFGNALNVRRTVREFEHAGVAGIHIEDQVWPKRCGHFEGKSVIPVDEMAQKIRAAHEARENPDFVVIARSDAIAVEGFEAALRRGEAYVDAGADMLFFDASRTIEQVETVAVRFRDRISLLINMAETGKTPRLPAAELGRLGYKVAIYPATARLAAVKAVTEVLQVLKETGGTGAVKDRMITFAEWTELTGLPEARALEERYGTDDTRLPGFTTGAVEAPGRR
ncbi:MAG TPA: isocitrate lyase/phosphoenolpyruvate mutase family protein [Casimicrobiaceae bacterium]|jgi:carboxyvinyl-carboxyphosphonate phosphorylmutase|nr:isocitrate lyase/phosphoenolpyruvate mutase family protein [Casimicrobiaceae bacterium]